MSAPADAQFFNPDALKTVGLALGSVSMVGGTLVYLLREPCRKWLFGAEMEEAKARQKAIEEHAREIDGLKRRMGTVEDSVTGIAGAVQTLKDMARSLREIKEDIRGMRQEHADTREDIAETKERVARIEGTLGTRPERRKTNRRHDVERRAPEDVREDGADGTKEGDDA